VVCSADIVISLSTFSPIYVSSSCALHTTRRHRLSIDVCQTAAQLPQHNSCCSAHIERRSQVSRTNESLSPPTDVRARSVATPDALPRIATSASNSRGPRMAASFEAAGARMRVDPRLDAEQQRVERNRLRHHVEAAVAVRAPDLSLILVKHVRATPAKMTSRCPLRDPPRPVSRSNDGAIRQRGRSPVARCGSDDAFRP